MNVHILSVPFDSGHAGARMGRGPDAFLTGGLIERLEEAGHAVELTRVDSGEPFPTEITTAFKLGGQLAGHVRAARGKGHLPLVLTGNCISCVGTIAGLGTEDIGVLWFDAHGDFHTPETTQSGFLDGMALAVATGVCWKTLAQSIEGFRPVPAQNVAIIGARAFDPGERERFESAGGTVLDPRSVGSGATTKVIASLRGRVDRLYVHLDLDMLDATEGRANAYSTPGGLTSVQVRDILSQAKQRFTVAAVTLSAYDPAEDLDRRVLNLGIEFAHILLEQAPSPAETPWPNNALQGTDPRACS